MLCRYSCVPHTSPHPRSYFLFGTHRLPCFQILGTKTRPAACLVGFPEGFIDGWVPGDCPPSPKPDPSCPLGLFLSKLRASTLASPSPFVLLARFLGCGLTTHVWAPGNQGSRALGFEPVLHTSLLGDRVQPLPGNLS